MERTVLLVRPEQKAKLARLAKREHVSTAEINRRAIDAYNPDLPDEHDLAQLADAVIASSAQTMELLTEARQAVKDTMAYFASKEGNHNGN